MKRIVFTLVLLTLGVAAHAQTTTTSEANTNSTATSAAQNAGNSQNIVFQSSPGHKTTTLKNTPGVILGGFAGSFSSDYCGGTTQGGVGGPGFSVAFGGPKIDMHCVQLRTFERTMQAAATISANDPVAATKLHQAAVDMLCNVSDEARAALSHQGLCSDLGGSQASAQVSQARRAARASFDDLYPNTGG